MSRRIDIELTSALADGSWTWRAAGARKPNGVVEGSILPSGSAVGDVLKVEVEQMLDGIEVQSVVRGRDKSEDANVLELLPSERPFEAVIETRAKRDRSERRDRNDRDDRNKRGRRDGRNKGDGPGKGAGKGAGKGDGRPGDGGRRSEQRRPHFEAPPEIPQRPKPKRLRPGKARRNEVLAGLAEEQRPVAELALQGIPAVRARVKEDNAKLEAEGKPTMPETGVVKMAEDLLPKLRVAEWLDRAEAAQRQMEHLDLRDLRSVVAASEDSIVARDESTRALAEELKASLLRKQDEELLLWFGDIDAAIGVGRVIRALRLSSQPPKAGVMFPPELARRLSEAATAALLPDDPADRWIAVIEAVAFSPVRTLVVPTVPPTTITDDLRATALRLGPALPQVAALLGVEVPAGAPKPKPLRQQPARKRPANPSPKPSARSNESKSRPKVPKPDEAKPDEAKPDQAKPDQAKPDETEAKPEEAKPDETEAKPDETDTVATVDSANEPVDEVAEVGSVEPVDTDVAADTPGPADTAETDDPAS